MSGRVTHLSHEAVQAYFRETIGKSVELRDAGGVGEVDPGDILTYRKGAKRVRTKLGKTRFEQARIQLATVNAALALREGDPVFALRDDQYAVNKKFWWMGYGGRMGVRQGVRPSDAINDVFENTKKYGMECATATMIILYKGILDVIGPDDFDRTFDRLRIFRWSQEHPHFTKAKQVGQLPGLLPGDHVYFENPEFHPDHSAFQGENVIYLGDGQYYGHGLGTGTAEEIIQSLNELRKDGATQSAFRKNFELRLRPEVLDGFDLNPKE